MYSVKLYALFLHGEMRLPFYGQLFVNLLFVKVVIVFSFTFNGSAVDQYIVLRCHGHTTQLLSTLAYDAQSCNSFLTVNRV